MKALALSWAVLAFIACATSTRQKTIGATVATLDAANVALNGSAGGCNGCFIQRHEQALIAAGSNEASTAAQLAAFRGKLVVVELALAVGYQAAAAAWTANTDGALAGLAAAAQAFASDLASLEGSGS